MRELLSTLVMISKINPGEKLIVRSKYISVDNRWGQWYRRMWDGEGRENTVQRLIDIYSEIREKVSFYLNEIDLINAMNSSVQNKSRNANDIYRLLRSIANDLAKSHRGIKNLITTYSDDSNTEARLESILENDIRDMYREISEILPEKYKPTIFLSDSTNHMPRSRLSAYHNTKDESIPDDDSEPNDRGEDSTNVD